MKINQKISLGFAAIAIPITLFSILMIGSVVNELKEVGLYSPQLYLIQNYATKTTEAVAESFAYIASSEQSEKEAFLVWAKEIEDTKNNYAKVELVSQKQEKNSRFLQEFIQKQLELIAKAKNLFHEFESKGSVSSSLFSDYRIIVDQLINDYKKAIKIEKIRLEQEQKIAINLTGRALNNIILFGIITIISSFFSGYLIANSISQPIKQLKLATIEVGNGNLDTLIEQKSTDEVGDLEISFSLMTERLKKSQEELLLAKNYTNNIFESMSDALIVTCLNGSIITVNKAICAMLKYEEHELIGQPFTNIYLKEELQFSEAQFDKLIQDGCDHKFEATYLAKDGSKIPVSFTSSLMVNEEQKIEGIVYIAQNITERKQAEVEINNALKKERELNALKSRFITMASHEFRTPLATILSSTELLEHYGHKWREEKKIEHLHRVQTAVKYITQLLNDVLLIGKVEAGKIEYNPTLLNLGKLCQDITEEIQALASKNHTIAFTSVGQSDGVFMDEKTLRHIITNLLTNAVKYSPNGGAISFNLICDTETAVFSIQDQGIGIPPEDQEKLFEFFHRGTNVSTIPGTGLGLAIVKKSVDLCGGKITVESEVSVGTTFTVTLPLNKQV